MAWFKKARKPIAADPAKPSRVPEGLWVKCTGCSQILYNKDLAQNLNVCPKCGYHFRMGSIERLRTLFDGPWTEYDNGLVSTDPLKFFDTKPYATRLKAGVEATGLKDAVVVASGRIDGYDTIVAAMEYGFIGGSMGVVADADGQDLRGPGASRSGAHPVHLGAHRSDDRRRHRQLRDAWRPEYRGTARPHRVRGSPRDRTNDPPEAARGIPTQ